jgi:hypothetical protein
MTTEQKQMVKKLQQRMHGGDVTVTRIGQSFLVLSYNAILQTYGFVGEPSPKNPAAKKALKLAKRFCKTVDVNRLYPN